jgi:tetratricopeptide (TPR) repeat protein
LKDYTGAIDDFNMTIQLNGKTPQTFNNLGCAYRETGKLDEAIAAFDNAINLANDFAPAYLERGIAKQKKNDLAGACSDWNTALKFGYYPAKEMIDKFCKSNSK